MATKTVAVKSSPVGTAMLEQLANLDAKSISPEAARTLLGMAFARSHQQRVDVLSEKAREGSLTSTEQAELDEFIRVADLLAILQSRARQALKLAGFSASCGTDQRNGVNFDQQDGSAIGGRQGWGKIGARTHVARHAVKSAESNRTRNLAWQNRARSGRPGVRAG